MKRDMDMIRDLMLQIENGEDYFVTISDDTADSLGVERQGLSQSENDKLEHHLWLLESSGFAKFTQTGTGWIPEQITWLGHDFLDSVRDPDIWKQTKERAKAAGGYTVDLLTDLAKGFIKTKIKQHTGIEF